MTKEKIGELWGEEEKKRWFEEQTIKRSYKDEVLSKIEKLKTDFDIIKYGALSYDIDKYPLFLVKTKNFDPLKKNVLITGGVHGYETSGVQGALGFLKKEALKYSTSFNIFVAPCVSPWGYETINRWNPKTVDPNRSFSKNGPSEECNFLLSAIENLDLEWFVHIDLHETTDTDNTVFRPDLEKRDGIKQDLWEIPDGFYLVGDSERPTPKFQKAIIDSVREVTHIAPTDNDGRIIGEKIISEGVIDYPVKTLKLCTSLSDAPYNTTTEVYPDSPTVDDQDCINAQVAAVVGALSFLLK